jgi:hypothetical protein
VQGSKEWVGPRELWVPYRSERMYGNPADMGQMRAKYVDWATYDRMEVSYSWFKSEQWAY